MPYSYELRISIMRIARQLRSNNIDGDVAENQRSVLFYLLDHEAASLGEIAEHEKVTPPSINRTINALEVAGYIVRATSAKDARKVAITLTNKGQLWARETRRQRDAWFASRISSLTFEEREILEQAAPIFKKLADS